MIYLQEDSIVIQMLPQSVYSGKYGKQSHTKLDCKPFKKKKQRRLSSVSLGKRLYFSSGKNKSISMCIIETNIKIRIN